MTAADGALFDLTDLEPAPPPPLLPINVLPAQFATTSVREAVGLGGQWQEDSRGRGWSAQSYAMTPSPAGATPDLESLACSPTQLDVDLRCDRWGHDDPRAGCQCVGEIVYVVGCWSCDWLPPGTSDENSAVEQYLDHAWPGFRELPCGPRWDREAASGKGHAKTLARYLKALGDLGYPEEWVEQGGPVWTYRNGFAGGRHVPGYTAFGGYDLGWQALVWATTR